MTIAFVALGVAWLATVVAVLSLCAVASSGDRHARAWRRERDHPELAGGEGAQGVAGASQRSLAPS